jgi:hypothetical protein
MDLTPGERAYLSKISERVKGLLKYLNSTQLKEDSLDPEEWYSNINGIVDKMPNINTDLSFIACLMAKDFLKIQEFDASSKSQSAKGLDVDFKTKGGERVIAEIKNTRPCSDRGDFGGNQQNHIKDDLDKLRNADAKYKYFFVTDEQAFKKVTKKGQKLEGITVVCLPKGIKDPKYIFRGESSFCL